MKYNNKDFTAKAVTCRASQEHATHGGQMYCKGNVIYSYGEHFPLALFTSEGVFVNIDKHSATTSKHQGLVKYELASQGIEYKAKTTWELNALILEKAACIA